MYAWVESEGLWSAGRAGGTGHSFATEPQHLHPSPKNSAASLLQCNLIHSWIISALVPAADGLNCAKPHIQSSFSRD